LLSKSNPNIKILLLRGANGGWRGVFLKVIKVDVRLHPRVLAVTVVLSQSVFGA